MRIYQMRDFEITSNSLAEELARLCVSRNVSFGLMPREGEEAWTFQVDVKFAPTIKEILES